MDKKKLIPTYAIVPLLFCFMLNDLIYFGTAALTKT